MVDDEQLERRMRDWDRAEQAAREAERSLSRAPAADQGDAVESPHLLAARLRRAADAILASILQDVRLRGPQATDSQLS